MTSTVTVRPMQRQDIPAVAMLCGQLGYPTSEADVQKRYLRLASSADDAIVVAAIGASVVGWIHLHVWQGLESGPDVELGGLVVDERRRGEGIGRMLMMEAERWARERGCSRVRLRSNVTRTEAHAFYESVGYEIFKTQYAFQKTVSA
jgi:GNAT superfamily N-acetyltransferase